MGYQPTASPTCYNLPTLPKRQDQRALTARFRTQVAEIETALLFGEVHRDFPSWSSLPCQSVRQGMR
jgi:hypothetical protein